MQSGVCTSCSILSQSTWSTSACRCHLWESFASAVKFAEHDFPNKSLHKLAQLSVTASSSKQQASKVREQASRPSKRMDAPVAWSHEKPLKSCRRRFMRQHKLKSLVSNRPSDVGAAQSNPFHTNVQRCRDGLPESGLQCGVENPHISL